MNHCARMTRHNTWLKSQEKGRASCQSLRKTKFQRCGLHISSNPCLSFLYSPIVKHSLLLESPASRFVHFLAANMSCSPFNSLNMLYFHFNARNIATIFGLSITSPFYWISLAWCHATRFHHPTCTWSALRPTIKLSCGSCRSPDIAFFQINPNRAKPIVCIFCGKMSTLWHGKRLICIYDVIPCMCNGDKKSE